MLGPFAAASRFTLSFTRGRYTAATVARRLRIDVHDDDDDNDDNALTEGTAMAP